MEIGYQGGKLALVSSNPTHEYPLVREMPVKVRAMVVGMLFIERLRVQMASPPVKKKK
jgi:hypothetical protein